MLKIEEKIEAQGIRVLFGGVTASEKQERVLCRRKDERHLTFLGVRLINV